VVKHHYILLALLNLALPFSALALDTLETSIDRNPAIVGEYLLLSVTADDNIDGGNLDTSALRQNFIIGRTSVSRSTQIINFDTSQQTQWQVLIAPKNTGNLVIPILTIDGVSSSPISLKVVPRGSQPEQTKTLFIRTHLSSDTAYVGQLITYKVKLYLAVELQRGVLTAPTLDGAEIKQLGKDVDSTELLNGRRYRVIERTYAMIADKPGKLVIDGSHFSGDILLQTSRNGGMFSFNQSRPIEANAAKSMLNIKPIPSEYHGEWLVSDLVVLNEDWPETTPEYEVGAPITRTITLLASNTDETSLPELSISVPSGLKTYPEKALRKTYLQDNQMVSQLTQTLAIVPTKPGNYTLPEISVPWWNPHTQRQEVAQLPVRHIIVTGAADAQLPILNQNGQDQFQANDQGNDQGNAQTHALTGSASYWPWLTLVFALLWLATLVLWRRALNQGISAATLTKEHGASDSGPVSARVSRPKYEQSQHALAQIESAGAANDTSKVLSALQRYFSEQYGQTMTLSSICQLSPMLASAINSLQASAFSKVKSELDYHGLLEAIKAAPAKTNDQNNSALEALNPNT